MGLYQNETVWLVAGGTSVVSIVVCVVAVALLISMRLHFYFTYRLVAYQALSLMLLNLAYSLVLLQFVHHPLMVEKVCGAIGFLVVYAGGVNLLFSLCAVLHLFCFAVVFKNFQRFEPICVLVCLLLPLVYSWIPFTTGHYGSDGFLCFMKTWEGVNHSVAGLVEEFTLFYGPLVGTVGVNAAVVMVTVVILARRALRTASTVEHHADGESAKYKTFPAHNYKMEAVKQLCPLVSAALFVLTFVLFPFGARVYDAALAYEPREQFQLDLMIGLVVGVSGLFLGLSLIAHLCYVRTKKSSRRLPPNVTDALGTRERKERSYGSCSVSVRTMYNVPPESVIDQLVVNHRVN